MSSEKWGLVHKPDESSNVSQVLTNMLTENLAALAPMLEKVPVETRISLIQKQIENQQAFLQEMMQKMLDHKISKEQIENIMTSAAPPGTTIVGDFNTGAGKVHIKVSNPNSLLTYLFGRK